MQSTTRPPPLPATFVSTAPEAARPRAVRDYARGRYLIDDLDYLATGGALRDRQDHSYDPGLGAIYSAQGFDGLPVLADARTLDALVAEGGQELFRGLTDPDYVNQFRNGTYYPGVASVHISGNGTYATTERAVALQEYAYGRPEGVIRMVLRPDARIGDVKEVQRLRDAAIAQTRQERQRLDQIVPHTPEVIAGQELLSQRWTVLNDLGRFAAASGYDAYSLEFGMNGYDDTYWVVLNRTAAVVEYGPSDPEAVQNPDRPFDVPPGSDHDPAPPTPARAGSDAPVAHIPGDATTDSVPQVADRTGEDSEQTNSPDSSVDESGTGERSAGSTPWTPRNRD